MIVDVVLHHGSVDRNELWEYDGWQEVSLPRSPSLPLSSLSLSVPQALPTSLPTQTHSSVTRDRDSEAARRPLSVTRRPSHSYQACVKRVRGRASDVSVGT